MIVINVKRRIESIYEELTKSEKKIADFVLISPEEVTLMTTSDLAKKTDASPATVTRFCKSIGMDSFAQLKVALASGINKTEPTEFSDIEANEKVESIKKKLLYNAHQSMADTTKHLDDTQIEKAVHSIEKAPIIYAFGIGASWLVAENFMQKFNRIGKSVVAISDIHIMLATLVSAPKDAIILLVSNSGNTKEIINLETSAKKHNIKSIGISQFGTNYLAKNADIPLHTVKPKEAELRSAATSSLHAQFMVIDILFFSYATKNYSEVYSTIEVSRKEVKDYNNI
ncbi:hypothetical protein T233_00532 [Vagococcus lutrae LBD1]|uniref:RpiR family phosphosugar-binding transcriptional regulator n=1 Tax=Vagococcus lutrae LBD1 TaxID=1408226 RepID=V6Q6V0_9ENTE|nr:MurR/RpiR family transcriptional regulator [Vagococcus lutrae]EST90390.1 hypothetical protein T233_00532 [Vagococcus lutrae LBD1]